MYAWTLVVSSGTTSWDEGCEPSTRGISSRDDNDYESFFHFMTVSSGSFDLEGAIH